MWLTAESLGADDPASLAHPDLPRVFVFDAPLLRRLRLSGKRLVFLAESVAETGAEVLLGDPVAELAGRRLADDLRPGARLPAAQRRARRRRPAPVAVAAPADVAVAALVLRLALSSSRRGRVASCRTRLAG